MIEIPCALAQRFRTVVRTSLMEGRRDWPLVLCRSGPHGLALEARQGDVAVRYEVAGTHAPEAIAFRASVLAEIEGRTQDSVELEQVAFGKGVARWTNGEVPRTLEIETVAPESVPSFPEVPRRLAAQPPEFIHALAEAARTTPRDAGRPALSRVQLRGKEGSLAATDGRQLFVQGRFRLPWAGNLLVPRVPAFGVRGLLAEGDAVGVGTAGGQVAVRAGAWLFLLTIDSASRFPDVQTVIPKESAVTTRLRLDPADAALLADRLAKLPGDKEPHAPVTLDLDNPPAVRSRGGPEGPAIELPLPHSAVSGLRVQLCTDRRLLGRALELGFREIQVVQPGTPVLCRDEQRVYVWMPLDAAAAIPPGPAGPSVPAEHHPTPNSSPSPRRRKTPMPTPSTKPSTPDAGPGAAHDPNGVPDLVAEVEALRSLLQEAATRAGRLAAALKLQRRQSRALVAAVSALRQLQPGS